MKKYLLIVVLVLALFAGGCQPAGQQIDTSAKGADPGKESKQADKESGNSSNGPTKAVTD